MARSDPFRVFLIGYCGTWVALLAASQLFMEANPFGLASKITGLLPSDGPMKYLGFVACASLIEMWHAAVLCDKDTYCEGMVAWSVAAGEQ